MLYLIQLRNTNKERRSLRVNEIFIRGSVAKVVDLTTNEILTIDVPIRLSFRSFSKRLPEQHKLLEIFHYTDKRIIKQETLIELNRQLVNESTLSCRKIQKTKYQKT